MDRERRRRARHRRTVDRLRRDGRGRGARTARRRRPDGSAHVDPPRRRSHTRHQRPGARGHHARGDGLPGCRARGRARGRRGAARRRSRPVRPRVDHVHVGIDGHAEGRPARPRHPRARRVHHRAQHAHRDARRGRVHRLVRVHRCIRALARGVRRRRRAVHPRSARRWRPRPRRVDPGAPRVGGAVLPVGAATVHQRCRRERPSSHGQRQDREPRRRSGLWSRRRECPAALLAGHRLRQPLRLERDERDRRVGHDTRGRRTCRQAAPARAAVAVGRARGGRRGRRARRRGRGRRGRRRERALLARVLARRRTHHGEVPGPSGRATRLPHERPRACARRRCARVSRTRRRPSEGARCDGEPERGRARAREPRVGGAGGGRPGPGARRRHPARRVRRPVPRPRDQHVATPACPRRAIPGRHGAGNHHDCRRAAAHVARETRPRRIADATRSRAPTLPRTGRARGGARRHLLQRARGRPRRPRRRLLRPRRRLTRRDRADGGDRRAVRDRPAVVGAADRADDRATRADAQPPATAHGVAGGPAPPGRPRDPTVLRRRRWLPGDVVAGVRAHAPGRSRGVRHPGTRARGARGPRPLGRGERTPVRRRSAANPAERPLPPGGTLVRRSRRIRDGVPVASRG